MADGTDDPAGTDDAVVEELAPAPPSPKRRRALWGALAVLALGAGTLAVTARDDDPPRLPVALGAAGDEKASPAAADMSMLAWIEYVAGDDLPELGGDGTAYRLPGDVAAGDLRRIADALGIEGDIVEADGFWRLETDEGTLEAYEGGGGSWWYSSASQLRSSDVATSDSGSGSSGAETGVESGVDSPATTIMDPCTSEEECKEREAQSSDPIAPPADLPTKAEARQIAVDLFESIGLDVDDAKVTVDGPYDAWYVSVEPTVDGMTVSGMYLNASVGSKGEITSAGGTLHTPERVGEYPTIDTRAAIDRLNAGTAYGTGGRETLDATASAVPESESTETTIVTEQANGGTEPAMGSGTVGTSGTAATPPECLAAQDLPADPATDPVPDTTIPPDAPVASDDPACVDPVLIDPMPTEPAEPMKVVLHDAERILVLIGASDGSTDSYLVPGYRMTGDEGHQVDVPSIDDESLLPTTPVEPQDDPQVDEPIGDPDGTVTTEPAARCAPVEPGPDGAVPDICLDPSSVPPAEPTAPAVGEG